MSSAASADCRPIHYDPVTRGGERNENDIEPLDLTTGGKITGERKKLKKTGADIKNIFHADGVRSVRFRNEFVEDLRLLAPVSSRTRLEEGEPALAKDIQQNMSTSMVSDEINCQIIAY
jgi:hypothetical protein